MTFVTGVTACPRSSTLMHKCVSNTTPATEHSRRSHLFVCFLAVCGIQLLNLPNVRLSSQSISHSIKDWFLVLCRPSVAQLRHAPRAARAVDRPRRRRALRAAGREPPGAVRRLRRHSPPPAGVRYS